MTGFFSATYASGLAIYFLISNLVGILQYYLFRRHYVVPVPSSGDKKPVPQKQTPSKAK
jgi:membrane protein insertase Oxa1/YidC/SpoIIIJ